MRVQDDEVQIMQSTFLQCLCIPQIALVSWGTQEICTGGGMRETTPESRDFHINLFKMVPFLKSILGDDDQDDYAPLTFIN